MIGSLIIGLSKRFFAGSREFILREVLEVRGLIQLLMKRRNTGIKWTSAEISEIKVHLRNIAKVVPALTIFVLPGGLFLLPILAAFLDRRQKKKRQEAPGEPK